MRILLVEDDEKQSDLIELGLKEQFGENSEGCSVTIFSTESEFRDSFETIARDSYDLAVIDMMLRWCDVVDEIPDPPKGCEDFGRAGARCCEMLTGDSRTKKTFVVVLTVLDNASNGLGLPPGCIHIGKTSDFARSISEAFLKSRQ